MLNNPEPLEEGGGGGEGGRGDDETSGEGGVGERDNREVNKHLWYLLEDIYIRFVFEHPCVKCTILSVTNNNFFR